LANGWELLLMEAAREAQLPRAVLVLLSLQEEDADDMDIIGSYKLSRVTPRRFALGGACRRKC